MNHTNHEPRTTSHEPRTHEHTNTRTTNTRTTNHKHTNHEPQTHIPPTVHHLPTTNYPTTYPVPPTTYHEPCATYHDLPATTAHYLPVSHRLSFCSRLFLHVVTGRRSLLLGVDQARATPLWQLYLSTAHHPPHFMLVVTLACTNRHTSLLLAVLDLFLPAVRCSGLSFQPSAARCLRWRLTFRAIHIALWVVCFIPRELLLLAVSHLSSSLAALGDVPPAWDEVMMWSACQKYLRGRRPCVSLGVVSTELCLLGPSAWIFFHSFPDDLTTPHA